MYEFEKTCQHKAKMGANNSLKYKPFMVRNIKVVNTEKNDTENDVLGVALSTV